MKKLIVLAVFFIQSCSVFYPTTFSSVALTEELITEENTITNLKEILEKYKGEEILIEVYAGYCSVSQDSFYDVKKIQTEYPNKKMIFLSVDHSFIDFKTCRDKLKVKGPFYYMKNKGKGALAKFLKLTKIPRFLKVDETGKIKVFNKNSIREVL